MDVSALPWLLATAITSTSLGVACVLAFSRRGLASTRPKKSPPEPEPTTTLHAKLATLEADQAELFSTLEKLTTTVKRLSSRAGMRDAREREHEASSSAQAPPVGASKADLLRHYGMSGKVGPDFARAQMQMELNPTTKRPN